MKPRAILRQLFGTHIAILLCALCAVAIATVVASRAMVKQSWERELEIHARVMATLLEREDDMGEADLVDAIGRMKEMGGHRFTLILPDGRVIGESEADKDSMDAHRHRPEVDEAFREGKGISQRYSVTMGQSMFYVARRIPQEGEARGVIRVAIPLRVMEAGIEESQRPLWWAFWGIILVAAALSVKAGLSVATPVAKVHHGLRHIAEGDFSYRIPLPGVPCLSELTRAINETAGQGERQIRALEEERNLRALILRNLSPGVVAIGANHHIMEMNEAARAMLGIDAVTVVTGKSLGDVIRLAEVMTLVEESEKTADPVEREATLGDMRLAMRSTPLNDVNERRIGSLLLLNDVTLIRRLETVRQDFVANVSHELRTPITSIKGFAEALLDGTDAETTERFLKIIMRQSGHLDTIIRDLTEIVWLEQNSAKTLERERIPVAVMIDNAIGLCQNRITERRAAVSVQCDGDLTANVHAGLVEQAIVNLVDNAVKYGVTPESPNVEVIVTPEGGGVCIQVRDHGAGIAPHHQERLFERFYRVDKGRSRDLGGTGLGLAIVKHIALIHNGAIDLSSAPGQGTAFSLRLP